MSIPSKGAVAVQDARAFSEENLSDTVGRCAANGASFAEPGNRHLNRNCG